MTHKPVLLNEVMEYLDPQPGNIILDATIGGGGHSKAIIQRILPKGKVIGIEQDRDIFDALVSNFQSPISNKNLILINSNFRDLDTLLESFKNRKINGVLFDLGMNSLQLEKSGRGFTFRKNEPLLMTYKSHLEPGDLTAKEILNSWPEKEIYEILKDYGEERSAGKISKKIIEFRKKQRFETTFDLVKVISGKQTKINPATRTFQALRIAVNDELNALKQGLTKAWELLEPKGRLVVISFHSLEDRIVKNFFSAKGGSASGGKEFRTGLILTKKPVTASREEIKINPRARSAKLRAIKKL